MSICDIMASLTLFMSTWPIPDEDPIYGAVGNYHTCLIQGFFTQFTVSVPCYNAALTVYYIFYIRLGWSAERIRLRIEPFLHAVPLMIATTTSIMGLALNLYNDDKSKCWISQLVSFIFFMSHAPIFPALFITYELMSVFSNSICCHYYIGCMQPRTCQESWKNNGLTNCIRGNNASLYRLLFYYMFVWISGAMITINMYLVYRAVLAHEKAFEKLPQKEGANNNRQQKEDRHRYSQHVAVQGYWFCAACYLTWIPVRVFIVISIFLCHDVFHANLLLTMSFFSSSRSRP